MKVKCMGLLLLTALSASACTRVPSTFGTSDVDSAPGATAPNKGYIENLELDRLSQIEAQIDESLARLNAAFDPDAPEANLDKLVVGTELDPAFANSPFLTRDQIIDKKIDEKNQALIDDEFSGNLDNVEETTGLDPADFSDINFQRAARIEKNLDQKAIEAVKSSSDLDEEKSTSVDLKTRDPQPEPESQTPPEDAQEGTRESLD